MNKFALIVLGERWFLQHGHFWLIPIDEISSIIKGTDANGVPRVEIDSPTTTGTVQHDDVDEFFEFLEAYAPYPIKKVKDTGSGGPA